MSNQPHGARGIPLPRGNQQSLKRPWATSLVSGSGDVRAHNNSQKASWWPVLRHWTRHANRYKTSTLRDGITVEPWYGTASVGICSSPSWLWQLANPRAISGRNASDWRRRAQFLTRI